MTIMGSIYMAGARPVRYVGKCVPCNRPVAAGLCDEAYNPANKKITCPDCKGECSSELMYGVLNKMICDDRCMGAYGPKCSCGCGGVNHGGIWSEVIDNVPAHVIEAYRKDQERRAEVARQKAEKKNAKDTAEFTSWAVDNADDILTVRAYTGDNIFILEAQAKVDNKIILSPNYLAAVIRAINEEMEKRVKEAERQEAALKSEHQAVVNATIVRTLTITAIIHLKDNYAIVPRGHDIPTKPLYKFTDPDGNVYAWFASSYQVKPTQDGTFSVKDVWQVGDTFKVTAKVKKHDEYKGVKQTVIYYVKVVK